MSFQNQRPSPFSEAKLDSYIEGYGPGTPISGIISTAKSGTGYIKILNENEEVVTEFQVPRDFMNHALNGDLVEGVVADDFFYEKPYGKVLSIKEPGKRVYIGCLLDGPGGSFFFSADNSKMYTDTFVPSKFAEGAVVGSKVQVEIFEWRDGQKNPTGKVTAVFGKKGENEAEMKAILASRGIDFSFPSQVEEESKHIHANAEGNFEQAISDPRRRDLRDTETMTIDPADAKDFDDALSCVFNEDGTVTIGVHIADVSHYVTPGTTLDTEARKREFSTYLVDRTIPMLPEVLSNDLCSLNPNTDKLAFSGLFTMNKEGNVLSTWFGKSVIHSNRRFAYEEAQEILNNKSGEYYNELYTINSLAKILRNRRFAAGAIDFADTEIKFELDETGKPISVYQKERLDAHKLVEEFMLLKNRLVAEEVENIKKKLNTTLPFMYRTHDSPDKERIEALALFLEAVGVEIPKGKDLVDPKVINGIIESVKDTPLQDLVSTEMLRSMAKAKYTVSNPKHFGLGFDFYCHFTSPIRRYPDLIAHRLFFKYLHGEKIGTGEWAQFEAIAKLASEREIEVMDAERESIKLKQVEYLSSKIGTIFDATISGISESGFFVEEKETKANGLIRYRSLTDDTYHLDRKKYAAVGAKTGKMFRLGDQVKVLLIKTDTDSKQIDFELV